VTHKNHSAFRSFIHVAWIRVCPLEYDNALLVIQQAL
jgi:hypothetical protein